MKKLRIMTAMGEEMNILGIQNFGNDPSACLLKDGKLVAMAEEERFVRVKHAYRYFPINAINFCLKFGDITLDDVDYISIGWNSYKYPEYMIKFHINDWRIHKWKKMSILLWELINLFRFSPKHMNSIIKSRFRKHGYKSNPEIKFVSHHLSHAASAYYYSGFNKASILTIDGHGDENCTVTWKGIDKKIVSINEFNIPNSLGWFYSAFTQYLGFVPYDGEGKVMGLAPYGKFNEDIFKKMKNIIDFSMNGAYAIDPQYTLYGSHFYGMRFTDDLVKLFGPPRKTNSKITNTYKDIAYAVQTKLEESVLNLTKRLVEQTLIKNICIAGGVGYNCKMNGEILKLDCVDDIFIQPIAGDNGSSLGSSLVLSNELGLKSFSKMYDVYLGPEYSNEEIEEALKSKDISYEYHDDIEGVCGELISKGKIIGWFQGRMECGPRALGNRSILADPTDPKMKDKVNYRVKHREPWRPFCPTMLKGAEEEFLTDPYPSPFMILAFDVIIKRVKDVPAVVHVDGTTRPQILEKNINPKFWRLIKSFEEVTSIPMVLNTSFNKRGEPIVCTPVDAIKCFQRTKMDALAIGNYLVRKV